MGQGSENLPDFIVASIPGHSFDGVDISGDYPGIAWHRGFLDDLGVFRDDIVVIGQVAVPP